MNGHGYRRVIHENGATPMTTRTDEIVDLSRLEQEFHALTLLIRELPVARDVVVGEFARAAAERYPFASPTPIDRIVADVREWLERGNVHTVSPKYYGLFNPAVHFAGAVADLLTAIYNPQVGGWFHSAAATEIEQYTLRTLAGVVGIERPVSAHFTSGGSEANLTAVLAALAHRFPEYRTGGIRAIPGRPVLFVSAAAHHSLWKSAQHTGLGRDAVRVVQVDDRLRMRGDDLRDQIDRVRNAGEAPFFVAATVGTTAAGIIDPLRTIGDICRDSDLWFHVDGAWGASAALSPQLRHHLDGISLADSLTWDAHKWLSVPMGAGMFFTTRLGSTREAFDIEASYVPQDSAGTDFYRESIQWSRRFIGLKLFMTLAHLGLDGCARHVEHQAHIGDYLRGQLTKSGWLIVNNTPLPLVCFTHPTIESGDRELAAVRQQIVHGGHWISTTNLSNGRSALRACITNYATAERDIDDLVSVANRSVAESIA
jgi:aromatic-L-amino-acid/L-tryptophan decarboxylase